MKNKFTNKISIDKNEVLRYLEYKGQHIDFNLSKKIDECINITKEKINPLYTLRVYPISIEDENQVTIKETDVTFKSKRLYDLLEDCKECILMSATLGIEIEREIRKYSYTELTKSIIIDACATTAIEELCDAIQNDIQQKLSNINKYTTMRYSPGYGDLLIDLNKKIIDILNATNEIGLTVTSSEIMIPRKSVVAIIGITEDKNKNIQRSCFNCSNNKTCRYKKGDVQCGYKTIHKE